MSHLDEGLITALLDGELPPGETRQARDHLATCGECNARFEEARAYFDEANRLVRVLDLPDTAVPAPLAVHPPPAPKRRIGFQVRHLAWAASLLLAIGLGYYGNEARSPRKQVALDSVVPAANEGQKPQAVGTVAQTAGAGGALQDERAKTEAAKDAPASALKAKAPTPAAEADLRSLDKEVAADKLAEATPAPAASGAPAPAPPARQPASAAPPVDANLAAATGQARREDGQAVKPAELRDAAAPEAAVRRAASPAGGFRAAPPALSITLEEAVTALGGSIRLINGLAPERVERLDGRQVAGAASDLTLIRVVYLDPPGRELWLDQQRGMAGAETGDTILLHNSDGGLSLQWSSPPDGWLSLTGHLTEDSLRSLSRRVQ